MFADLYLGIQRTQYISNVFLLYRKNNLEYTNVTTEIKSH